MIEILIFGLLADEAFLIQRIADVDQIRTVDAGDDGRQPLFFGQRRLILHCYSIVDVAWRQRVTWAKVDQRSAAGRARRIDGTVHEGS